MANLRPIDFINYFDQKIKNPANNSIEYGTDNLPTVLNKSASVTYGEEEYLAWFGGTTDGVNERPNAAAFSGDVKPEQVRQAILDSASKFSVIRRVKYNMRYRSSDDGVNSYDNFETGTGYTHLSNDYLQAINAPTVHDVKSGEDADLSALESYIDKVAVNVKSLRDTTVNLSKTYCHSSCHSSCHSNCHSNTVPVPPPPPPPPPCPPGEKLTTIGDLTKCVAPCHSSGRSRR